MSVVSTRWIGNELLVTISGPLTLATSDGARTELADVETLWPHAVIVDARGVTEIDSSGLSLLLYLHRTVTQHGARPLAVVAEAPEIFRAFSVTSLDRVMDLRRELPTSVVEGPSEDASAAAS